jgi:hypothetical protein
MTYFLCLTSAQGFCTLLFLVLHVLARPFRHSIDNTWETVTQSCLVVVCLFLSAAPASLPPATAGGLGAMCLVVALALAVRVVKGPTFSGEAVISEEAGAKPHTHSSAAVAAASPARSGSTQYAPVSQASPSAVRAGGAVPPSPASASSPAPQIVDSAAVELHSIHLDANRHNARSPPASPSS